RLHVGLGGGPRLAGRAAGIDDRGLRARAAGRRDAPALCAPRPSERGVGGAPRARLGPLPAPARGGRRRRRPRPRSVVGDDQPGCDQLTKRQTRRREMGKYVYVYKGGGMAATDAEREAAMA